MLLGDIKDLDVDDVKVGKEMLPAGEQRKRRNFDDEEESGTRRQQHQQHLD